MRQQGSCQAEACFLRIKRDVIGDEPVLRGALVNRKSARLDVIPVIVPSDLGVVEQLQAITLRDEQHEGGEAAQERGKAAFLGASAHAASEGLALAQFAQLLLSPANRARDAAKLAGPGELDAPLTHYWIACSHNSLITLTALHPSVAPCPNSCSGVTTPGFMPSPRIFTAVA